MPQFSDLLTAVQLIKRKLYNVMLYRFALVILYILFISFVLLSYYVYKKCCLSYNKTIVKKSKIYNPPAACYLKKKALTFLMIPQSCTLKFFIFFHDVIIVFYDKKLATNSNIHLDMKYVGHMILSIEFQRIHHKPTKLIPSQSFLILRFCS